MIKSINSINSNYQCFQNNKKMNKKHTSIYMTDYFFNSENLNSKKIYLEFTGIKHTVKSLYKKCIIKFSPLKLHLTKYDTEAVLNARINQYKAQKALEKSYGVISTDLINTQERKLLRLKIASKLLKNGLPAEKNQSPELYITIGLPGSGKSSVIEKPILKKSKAIVLDKDDAKMFIPEYKNGEANYVVCDEADDIVELAYKEALKNRFNLIRPNIGTVYQDIKEMAIKAKEAGYKVHLRFVDVDKDIAAQRAVSRFETTGRYTETLIHKYLGDKPRENYLQLITKDKNLFDSYVAYSNNVKKGEPPIFLKGLSSIKQPEI